MSTVRASAAPPALDGWVADPAVRTFHRREARAEPDALWRAAATVRVGESGLLGHLIRWRVPGTRAEQTYREMFSSSPFVDVAHGDGHLLAGLCGRIWSARPTLADLSGPDDFRRWSTPGTVRVLFAQWVEATAAGSALISEVRVAPVDVAASARLRRLWPLIRRFEPLISTEPLGLAVRRAESTRFRRV